MDNSLLNLSAGGVLLILALREIRGILNERAWRKNGNGPNTSGAKSPEFWQAEFRKIVVEAFSTTVMPALTQHTDLLRDIRGGQQKLSDELLKMVARQSVKKGTRG